MLSSLRMEYAGAMFHFMNREYQRASAGGAAAVSIMRIDTCLNKSVQLVLKLPIGLNHCCLAYLRASYERGLEPPLS